MTSDAPTVKIHDRRDLVRLLEPFNYPISKDELIRKAPEVDIFWTHRVPISLKDAIHVLHGQHFDTLGDAVDSLEGALRLAYRDYNSDSQEKIIEP